MATKHRDAEPLRKKNVSIHFYCNEEEFARLQAIAEMSGQSVPRWLSALLRERLQDAAGAEKGEKTYGTPPQSR
jgi:hypothetical protein